MPELWGTQYTRAEDVVVLKPSNCRVEGRATERASGRLQFLKTREVGCFAIEIEFFELGRVAQ